LLHQLPADAGANATRELARTPIATAANSFFFIFVPLTLNSP
jgi:hypothetical protein